MEFKVITLVKPIYTHIATILNTVAFFCNRSQTMFKVFPYLQRFVLPSKNIEF